MGSWDVGCALSGINIGIGDECFRFTTKQRADAFYPGFEQVPVLGTYNDYGDIKVAEGEGHAEDWEVDAGRDVFISKAVFDSVQNLTIEYYGTVLDIANESVRRSRERMTGLTPLSSNEDLMQPMFADALAKSEPHAAFQEIHPLLLRMEIIRSAAFHLRRPLVAHVGPQWGDDKVMRDFSAKLVVMLNDRISED